MDGLGIIYGKETEMHELKVGDKLKDNDPRMGDNRILTIVELLPNGVVAENCIGQRRRYLRKRIHTDGKARQSGMNLLMPNDVAQGSEPHSGEASPGAMGSASMEEA